MGVGKLCKEVGIPCIAMAGSVDLEAEKKLREIFSACFSICSGPMERGEAMRRAAELLTFAGMNVLKARIAGKSIATRAATGDFL